MTLPSMNLNNAPSGGNFPDVPAGAHLCNIVRIIDLGQQYSEKYKKASPRIRVGFEVTDFPIEFERDGQRLVGPALAYKEYTFSNGQKADLPKLFAAADPTGQITQGEVWNLLGLPLIVSFAPNPTPDKPNRTKVANVSGLIPGAVPQPPTVEIYGFSPQSPDPQVWAKLSTFVKEKIRDNQSGGAQVYQQMEAATAGVTPQYTPPSQSQTPPQPTPQPDPAYQPAPAIPNAAPVAPPAAPAPVGNGQPAPYVPPQPAPAQPPAPTTAPSQAAPPAPTAPAPTPQPAPPTPAVGVSNGVAAPSEGGPAPTMDFTGNFQFPQ